MLTTKYTNKRMRWSEKQTYQFVKQYMKHENLWNSKHEYYKVSSIRMKSYKELISQFRDITGIDMNIAELKIKIKNLRTTYMQEMGKIKRRSGPGHAYKSNLRWFPVWHKRFHYANRRAEYGLAYENQQGTIDDPSDNTHHTRDLENSSEDSPIEFFVDHEDYNMIYKAEPTNLFTKQDLTHHSKTTKHKFKQHHSSSIEISDKSFSGSTDPSECMKDDEFDIYGKYIAAQLREMDLHEALRIQLEIQSIVSVARLTNLIDKES